MLFATTIIVTALTNSVAAIGPAYNYRMADFSLTDRVRSWFDASGKDASAVIPENAYADGASDCSKDAHRAHRTPSSQWPESHIPQQPQSAFPSEMCHAGLCENQDILM
ncbi:hypothetical protein FPV67DRAFT_254226 [Lyophyllum atratum]|nr:hypothetical protein FPV67DRAFT_254226 [Lyophyllum atratum]